MRVAVLYGGGDNLCSGLNLKALIADVEGYAVATTLKLAAQIAWFCRRAVLSDR